MRSRVYANPRDVLLGCRGAHGSQTLRPSRYTPELAARVSPWTTCSQLDQNAIQAAIRHDSPRFAAIRPAVKFATNRSLAGAGAGSFPKQLPRIWTALSGAESFQVLPAAISNPEANACIWMQTSSTSDARREPRAPAMLLSSGLAYIHHGISKRSWLNIMLPYHY